MSNERKNSILRQLAVFAAIAGPPVVSFACHNSGGGVTGQSANISTSATSVPGPGPTATATAPTMTVDASVCADGGCGLDGGSCPFDAGGCPAAPPGPCSCSCPGNPNVYGGASYCADQYGGFCFGAGTEAGSDFPACNAAATCPACDGGASDGGLCPTPVSTAVPE